MELAGEGCKVQIDEGVRVLGVEEGYGRGLGAGGGLTEVNRAGGRGGSGWPEPGKETSSRSSQWPGGVLVSSGGAACTRVSSGPLYIGGPRRLP